MTLDDILTTGPVLQAVPAPSDETLQALANEVGGPIQRIQDLAGREERAAAKIRFPRGYLIEIGRWRKALPFVRTNLVRSTVADTLMMHDVQAWVLKRTDLGGHAVDMLVKAAIASLGGIAEALLIDATSPPMGQRQKIASRIERLLLEGVLNPTLAENLSWLWEIRNRQHLHGLSVREFDVYSTEDHPRAEASVAALIISLQSRATVPAA